ncbi:MAG TPA: maleylpyruvate isomerase N-terminal domain-containing protein [Mycobacterium sp.]|nr:maleylpyruvate isomerase N-terminal domain-containing protein [Mycobacterium sp.]
MTSAPVHLTGPAEDTRRAYRPTLNALRIAVARSADLWRNIDKPDAPAPGLQWTAAETAAHVVGDLRDYTQALTRHTGGYMTHANRPTESPSRLSAKVNARHLEEIRERNLSRLADMLEVAADAYLNAAANADLSAEIATPNGLVIGPPTMAALLLGEQLIHGLDISRTAKIRWPIAADDAFLVIPGVLTVAPQYLRPQRAAGVRISFELRMRGGASYRLTVDDGTAVVTAAGEKADCHITADPVAFLLLGYGRIGQLSPVLRGQLRPGGRKPWLAMRFGTLLETP